MWAMFYPCFSGFLAISTLICNIFKYYSYTSFFGFYASIYGYV